MKKLKLNSLIVGISNQYQAMKCYYIGSKYKVLCRNSPLDGTQGYDWTHWVFNIFLKKIENTFKGIFSGF